MYPLNSFDLNYAFIHHEISFRFLKQRGIFIEFPIEAKAGRPCKVKEQH